MGIRQSCSSRCVNPPEFLGCTDARYRQEFRHQFARGKCQWLRIAVKKIEPIDHTSEQFTTQHELAAKREWLDSSRWSLVKMMS
jgi:hypothetical protein